MKVDSHILLWNQAYIKIMDIRRTVLEDGEEMRAFRLPASAFFYTVSGSGRVYLDQSLHYAERFHLLHGGKGMVVDILAEERLEYYLILYKATLPLLGRQAALLLEEENPFYCQYAFAPDHPVLLFDKLERLEREWRALTELGKLQAKGLLYQFVHEIFEQLARQNVKIMKPNRVDLAIRYMESKYAEPITMDEVAASLDCSAAHLSRLFKAKLRMSPIQYLGRIRIERAKQLLLRTDATIQEIAESVGFPDAHSLSRSFKKYAGTTPARYRLKREAAFPDQKMPMFMQEFALLKKEMGLYNEFDNHFHYRTGREIAMQKKIRIAGLTMLMCVSLLVAACSGTSQTNGSPSPQPTQQTSNANADGKQTAAQTESLTRTVSTKKGDVEVPAEPKRVVSDQYMGQLLKLGIIPIGVRSMMLDEGWMEKAGISKELLDGIENLGDGFPMNAEKMIELEPDLIIGSVENSIEQYEKIGTTVFLPYWEQNSTAGPLEKFRNISDIFGKRDEAEKWIAEYEQKAEEARKKIEGVIKPGETVSVIQIGEKEMFVFAAEGGNYGSTTIYQMLQLPPTQSAMDMENGFKSISFEVMPEYLGDHVFVYNGDPKAIESVMNSEVWKSVPAVKNGQVYLYGNEYYDEFLMEDPYSLEQQLDTIVNLLLGSAEQG